MFFTPNPPVPANISAWECSCRPLDGHPPQKRIWQVVHSLSVDIIRLLLMPLSCLWQAEQDTESVTVSSVGRSLRDIQGLGWTSL